MQSNDVFIVSSIMKSLIDHIIWVQPSWRNESASNRYLRTYAGVTNTKNYLGLFSPCICQQMVYKKIKKKTPFECFMLNRESEDNIDIELKECKMIRSYIVIMVNEDRFIKSVKLNNVKNLFVDIDEDYFGVESGVKTYINQGLKYQTILQVNQMFSLLFCPKSMYEEQILNIEVQNLFSAIFGYSKKHGFKNDHHYRYEIQELLFDNISKYFCKTITDTTSTVVHQVTDVISLFVKEEIKALSKVKYCLANSPQLLNETTRFILCHGTIHPQDTLNQIHISNHTEIIKRGEQLELMLDFIYQHKEPHFFTIARSLRDGYTPRFQQRFIEETVLKAVTHSIRKHGKTERIIYDKYLVFGKKGWVE